MKTITEAISNPAEFTERFINQTNQSVFLTGKAGTGKTTLLRKIVDSTHKQTVIVAPTGIAALNAGGVTIHSFFQLPFGGFIPEFIPPPQFSSAVKFETKDTLKRHFHFNSQRQQLFRSMELLIIDEVSMLRADLLDAMDWSLRNVRKTNLPFGGVQVLFIGDLLQLPPVVKNEEWSVLRKYYHGLFFFHARVILEQAPVYIELSTIYRQQDHEFIQVLNNLRNNQISDGDMQILNRFVQPDFRPEDHEGYITLTTHNNKADEINTSALKSLDGKSWFYKAEIEGEFPQHIFPIDETLELKEGAQVMFIKNDISFEKNFYNGKMGRIESLSENEIFVHFPDEKRTIEVQKYEWENIKYGLNDTTGEITEEVQGTFVHYPLKLAWAITVHKSQGLTFDKAVLDVSQVFAPGQAYVALSRLRTLGGLVLLKPISMNGLSNDQQVVAYAEQKADQTILEKYLEHGTRHYIYRSLVSAFDWVDFATNWMVHENSYKLAGLKTEKSKDKSWASHQSQALQSMLEPAKKFQNQLGNLFSKEQPDWSFVLERVQAAYQYFYKPLDNVYYSMLKRMAELQRIKKTKQYVEELEELEQQAFDTIMRLKKARLLVEAITAGREITKEAIWSEELNNYKIAKIAIIKQELREKPSLLDPVDEDDYMDAILLAKTKKTPKTKTEKKTTYDQTLELFRGGQTIREIIKTRQLSSNTIYTHFVNLIRAEKVELRELMVQERINEIAAYFEGIEYKTLTDLKEQLGDKVTWEELKLYQASTII
jgi:hypothetical protein